MRQNIISVAEALELAPRFIDARWYMPNDGRTSRLEFEKSHIEGAVRLDIDKLATLSPNHPHLMPEPEQVIAFLSQAGIKEHDLVVIYDDGGFFTAPRGWWMLKSIGHEHVKVLEGGLKAWIEAGGSVATKSKTYEPSSYSGHSAKHQKPVSRHIVEEAIAHKNKQIVDARPAQRFTGEAPEPRPDLSSGHMPTALNIPFASLVDENGHFHTPDALHKRFLEIGLSKDKPVIATCGSGITACVVLLGLYEAGWTENVALYDGSWIEWVSHPDAKIEKN